MSNTQTPDTRTFDGIRRVPLVNGSICIGDEIVGRVKNGSQGLTIGKAFGYVNLSTQHARLDTAFEVELFGRWVKGSVDQMHFVQIDFLNRRARIPPSANTSVIS